MKKLLTALLSMSMFFAILSIQAQTETVKRIAVYDMDLTQYQELIGSAVTDINKANLRQIPEYVISYYTNDDRFIVIDKAKSQLIKEEKERQKSEEFIDGYIVNQGKEEGFDYIFYTKYFKKEGELSLRVYDVENETVMCEARQEIDKTFGILKNLNETAAKLVQELNTSCFSIFYDVVRSVDKKQGSAVKNLLILAGKDQKMQKGYMFEILKKEVEKVGEKSFERYVPVGLGDIQNVEDENFSVIQVRKGGKKIKALLDAQTDLVCKFLRK